MFSCFIQSDSSLPVLSKKLHVWRCNCQCGVRGSPWIAGLPPRPKKRKVKTLKHYTYFMPTYKDWVSHNLLIIDRLWFVALMVDYSCYQFREHNSRLWELSDLLSPYMTLSKYIVISVSETVHGLSGKYGKTKDTFACSCAFLSSLNGYIITPRWQY